MRAIPRARPDPDFDAPGPRPGRPVDVEWAAGPSAFRRLVVNPFLALLGLVAWWGLVSSGPFRRAPYLVVPALSLLAGLPPLLQYHCLDCGATGRLLRWRRHACPAVRDREAADRPRRFRGPSPPLQLIIWAYVVGSIAVVLFILRSAGGGLVNVR